MYLIAAEAGAHLGGDKLSQANKYLNDFCKKRYTGYKDKTYSANELIKQTLAERKREFIGEGMLWSDLRRTNEGFQRISNFDIGDPELDKINGVIFNVGKNLKYEAGDYRFTWPIPKDEMDSNPQMKGQQNPGY